MPNNFANIGLLALALPNARIINARRHPLDTCLSCYRQLFARGQPFTYDLTELGEYYLEYEKMMAHWHAVLPGRVLDVQYEDVVADQAGQTRRLLRILRAALGGRLPALLGNRARDPHRELRAGAPAHLRRFRVAVAELRARARAAHRNPAAGFAGVWPRTVDLVYPPGDRHAVRGEGMSSQPNNKVPVTRIAYAVSVALTGNYAPAVLAQSQTADLEAVIVTARKREETLLDIPQEIQAISQEQLERANLDSVEDFSRFVPSLSYNAMTPGRGSIYFRGVADDSSSFIADASAAIYLDEQPLTQSALQPEVRLVDIERIEALPGPQGTLYGASSQSGTLRYITNKPDPGAFYADVGVDGHSVEDGDEGYDVSGVLNLPLGDDVAIRLVGFSARDAGFIDNVLGESLGGTFDNADVVDEDVNDARIHGRPRGGALAAERELDRGRGRRLPEDGREQLRGRQRPAIRPRERGRALPRREPRGRVDADRADAAGRPRLRPVHVGDQLLHAPHRLLPGQHGLHVLPLPTRSARLTCSTTSARIRSASAGATARMRTASRRNSACRARRRR